MHLAKNLLQSRAVPLLFLSDRHWLVLRYPEIEVMRWSTSDSLSVFCLDKLQSVLKHALRHDKPTTTQVKLSLNYYENSTREAWCAYYSSYLKHTFLYENNTKQGQIHKAQSTPLNNARHNSYISYNRYISSITLHNSLCFLDTKFTTQGSLSCSLPLAAWFLLKANKVLYEQKIGKKMTNLRVLCSINSTLTFSSQLPCIQWQHFLSQPNQASSCTSLQVACVWEFFAPMDDNERCSHLLHWVGKPRCEPSDTLQHKNNSFVEYIKQRFKDDLISAVHIVPKLLPRKYIWLIITTIIIAQIHNH